MSPVEEIVGMNGGPLTARDAFMTVREYGLRRLAVASFVRFRYGDGFSHARALGLQLALAAVPLVIATVGVAAALRRESVGLVLRRTILELTPRASDTLLERTLSPFSDEGAGGNGIALTLGVLFAVVALTTGMGQLQRGANRIYGIQRDRPGPRKYTRAFVLCLTAGLPAMAGFLVLVAAEAFAEAVQQTYGLDDDLVLLATRPAGTALLLLAVTAMLRHAPFRRQPGWSLLALGAVVALVSWVAVTALLAGFLHLAADIGSIYGPLTGVMALLLWAQMTAGALFLGFAVSAQLEEAEVGRRRAPDSTSSTGRRPAPVEERP